MSDLQKLTSRRNALMAQVRGELSVADAIMERKPSLSEVRDRLNQLKELAASFRETQMSIEEKQDDLEAIASVHNVREEFFRMFYRSKDIFEGYIDDDEVGSSASQQTVAETRDWKDALHLLIETQRKLMLDQATTMKTVQNLSQLSSGAVLGDQVSNCSPHLNVRLPAINIQPFAGDRKQWISFKDIYMSTIHNRGDISDALKMQYLFSYLDGDAKRLVSKFPISGANYRNAWSTLTDHFDKKRYTVFSLVHEFMAQSPVMQCTSQSLGRLVTTSDEIIQQLDALGDEYTSRDPWLIHVMLEKLDKETRTSWSQEVVDVENPSFDDMLQFLKKRCEVLETCAAFSKKPVSELKKETTKSMVPTKLKTLHATVEKKCAKCSSEHNTYQCEQFLNMSVNDRRELVKRARLCFNCLRPSHSVKSCSSKSVCHNLECQQRHHTLLCPMVKKPEEEESNAVDSALVEVPAEEEEDAVVALTAEVPQTKKKFLSLLPTAVVKVQHADGTFSLVRVLIDSGSQASLISEACVRMLKLPRRNGKIVVNGLGQQEMGTTRGLVTLRLSSRFNDVVVLTTEAYVLGKLTSTIPSQRFNPDNMKLLSNVGELADPDFNRPGSVDIILGADVFLALLEGGQVKDASGQPVAQRTIFGWIVAGRYDASEAIQSNHAVINLHLEMDLNRTLQRFWEQEEIFKTPPLTPSEQQVTEYFSSTLQRDETGRFIVRLPFDDSKPPLGDTLAIATKRLKSIERRFQLDPEFKRQYVSFMREYLELGHMEEVPADQIEKNSSECYYLPHHAVIKADSLTTKLRVVFDASCASSSGVSLNDRLLAGPNNNADLFDVSLRFRSHRVAFCADVTKMYRQALVHPEDRDYLRIVFREDPEHPLKHYRLCTVTYGTKTAPFLAIECMREAAKPFEAVYPEAVEAIRNDFYVDDFLSGADDEEAAGRLKDQVVEILSSAGFELRKWSSNNKYLLPSNDKDEAAPVPVKMLSDSDSVKALGINWYPFEDEYGFKVNLSPLTVNTKRQMISDSSRLFDPFGWLAPVTVKIKILYQHLWLFDVAWDDPLPPAIEGEWDAVKQSLSELEVIRIPRCIFPERGGIQLHGFADASEQAYAAVVYARTINEEGNVSVVLVAAKSRVAPIKQVSLPRLELNGALLLTDLMRKITEALPHVQVEHWAWTDSSIVLQWLASHPRKWKTFVANRTAAILDYLPRSCWRHVASKDNPADLATRGLSPAELVDNQLWFQGAPWLKDDESNWNQGVLFQEVDEDAMEAKRITSLYVATAKADSNYEVEKQLISKCSSFSFMVRLLACVHRAIHNFKATVRDHDTDGRRTGELTPDELHQAKIQLLKAAQHDEYDQELELLRKGKSLQTKHVLLALHPFVDADGTMRVGGRLQNSSQPYDAKHPIILPQKHRVTEQLVRDLHLRNLHAGSALLAATVRQHYWIVGCQTVVRKVVQGCTRCVRLKGKTAGQLMGSLPPARVLATRPFSHVGVDYAGPLRLKATCVRGVKVTKGYLVVFVCLSTRAVHLEVASDLSSDTFLGALKRFISRRGYPVEVWSDNGTNFVGADRKLREFLEQILSHSKNASHYLSNLGIKWVFNPPSAPHMGGIWEAAVRSVKKHLVAELGESTITFEHLSTLLCQIESCLNSRPLCPLSSDPDSAEALTPGHFLVGQPMNLVPEPGTKHLPANRLDHWQQVQQQTERVWSRWKDEYLASLQPRSKWRTAQSNIGVGQLVIVKNDNAPPAQWELARVDKIHPDTSGAVRVVTLRRGATVYQRPVHKLCVLPAD